MEYILTDFLLAGFGWLFLVLRYRNKGRIAQVLKANYNGSYSNVGLVFFLNMVAFSIALLSCGLLIALVISLL